MLNDIWIYITALHSFIVGRPLLFVALTGLLLAAGSAAGETAIYWAARIGGRPLIERLAARGWLRLDLERYGRAERWFSRWGVGLVLFGRILPGVRTLVSVPAGLSRMNFALFLSAAFSGACVWNTLLVAVGYGLGLSAGVPGVLLNALRG